MKDHVRILTAADEGRYRVPRTVRDLIHIDRIWKDGIFLFGDRYSMTWSFSDINYSTAGDEERQEMFRGYCRLLNGLDPQAETKITIWNRRLRQQELEQSVLMKERGDGLDRYRKEYNDIVVSAAAGSGGIVQEKYVTISIQKRSVEEAREYFSRTDGELSAAFSSIGSGCAPVDAAGRLRLLHEVYRGEEQMCGFDIGEAARNGRDFRDFICPDGMEIRADHLKLGERYARVLFLKHYASYLSDSFIRQLTEICQGMMLSADIISIPTEDAVKEVENRLLGIETGIASWQKRQDRSRNFSALVPYDLDLQRQETKEFLDDLMTRDQRMMMGLVTVLLTADSMRELDSVTEQVISAGRSNMCQIAVLRFQQGDGLSTVLPLGPVRIKAFRTLVTESLASLIPFRVREIMDPGGTYLGINAVSGNPVLCSREKLMNQSAFLLGVPGSGKSFCAKQMILSTLLNTDDDILICDPEGEYRPLALAMGDRASCVRISSHGYDRLDPMLIESGYSDGDPASLKSEFILSLIERIENGPVGPRHRSVIDRCVALVYREAERSRRVPTLTMLREMLMGQEEPEARETALSLELYTEGSLNIFGGESNVDLDKRMVVFDIHDLGENLRPAGLLVITDTMLNRVTRNWRAGRRTHVFIDEFHVVFSNEHSARFFSSAWRQFRKRNAFATAITQNVESLLDSVEASTMLSNSEFLIMFSQAAADREKLAGLTGISDKQMKYISSGDPGAGLIRYGNALVPFVNHFPRDTSMYELMTTDPGERKYPEKRMHSE